MLLTIHIWQYKSVNTAIYLPQRKTTENASQVPSLYARWIQRYLIHKYLPVPLACSSRVQNANNWVREIYFSTMNNQRRYDTGTSRYITSQRHNWHYAARGTKPVLPAHKYSWIPNYCSTHLPVMCLQKTCVYILHYADLHSRNLIHHASSCMIKFQLYPITSSIN